MKFHQLLLAGTLLFMSVTAFADTTIDFEGLNTSSNVEVVPDGYAGMVWVGFSVANGAAAYPQTGFESGTVSGTGVGFNPSGNDASMNLMDYITNGSVFELKSLYLTKAAGSGNTLIWGVSNRQLAYRMEVTATSTGPTLISFDWTNLNGIVIQTNDSSGATVFDDITINITPASQVPEPESYAMLLAGLALVGALSSCKKAADWHCS